MVSMTAYIILVIAYVIMAAVNCWNVRKNRKLREQHVKLCARCHALTLGRLCMLCDFECPYRASEKGDWSGTSDPEEEDDDE